MRYGSQSEGWCVPCTDGGDLARYTDTLMRFTVSSLKAAGTGSTADVIHYSLPRPKHTDADARGQRGRDLSPSPTKQRRRIIQQRQGGGSRLRPWLTEAGMPLLQGQALPEPAARALFQQLMVAVDYCHRLGIANRDIKVRQEGCWCATSSHTTVTSALAGRRAL